MTDIKEYKQKDGKVTYYFNTYLGVDPLTGKKKIVTRRGFNTKKEAKSELAKLQYEFDNGLLKQSSQMTYKDLYNEWIKSYSKDVIPSTINWTTRNFRLHILPEIGHLEIGKITSLDCQALYNTLTNKLKKGSVIYGYAKSCYQFAIVPLRLVGDNPFELVYKEKEKSEKPTYKFLELKDLKILLETIKEKENYMWYAFFTLMGFTGLRVAEELALTWNDLEGNQLTIDKTMTRDINNSYIVGKTPKTDAGNRVITIDPHTLKILNTWRGKQKIKSVDNIMFTNTKGSYIAQSKPLKILNRVTKRSDLKRVTNHDLRRTHTCHLFDAGIGVKEVQARLGQKDLKTTMEIYNFVTEYRKEKSIDKFEEYLSQS